MQLYHWDAKGILIISLWYKSHISSQIHCQSYYPPKIMRLGQNFDMKSLVELTPISVRSPSMQNIMLCSKLIGFKKKNENEIWNIKNHLRIWWHRNRDDFEQGIVWDFGFPAKGRALEDLPMIAIHRHSWMKVWVKFRNKSVENLEKMHSYRVKSVSFSQSFSIGAVFELTCC